MQNSNEFISDDGATEFKIRIACECYSDSVLVRDVLAQLPVLNGKLKWGVPREPDPLKLIDAELVLIVSDRTNLLTAVGRSVIYRNLGLAHLLIYVQEETDLPVEVIPGLVLPRSQLAGGLLRLTQVLLEPTISQGLVGVDWADTRSLLTMGGQIVLENATASQPENAIQAAIRQLQARSTGRVIHGLQVAILCHEAKLATRHIGELTWACRDATGDDTCIIVAAPLLSWPDHDSYEVRLFASVECTGAHWPRSLFLNFSKGMDV